MSIRSNWLIVLLKFSLSFLLGGGSISFISFWERGVKISSYDCGFVSFLLLFCQFGFINVEILLLSSYILVIVISCQLIVFNLMKWSLGSLVIGSAWNLHHLTLHSHTRFSDFSVCIVYLFPSICFPPVLLFYI